jgi:hypothetical protein
MEHRWGKRQSTDLRVRFVSRAKIGTGCLSNVSVTGAFMKTKVHLRLLSVLNLSIASHSRKARDKGVAACVVRRDSAGVGLEWCEAGHTSIEARLALLVGYAAPASRSAAEGTEGVHAPGHTRSTVAPTDLPKGRGLQSGVHHP